MGSFGQGALIEKQTSTITSGGTTTFLSSSKTWQRFTGSSDETIVLPDAMLLKVGRYFRIENQSTGRLTIQYAGGLEACKISSGTQRLFNLYNNITSAGDWVFSAQVDLEEPLALYGTRPVVDQYLNIAANQILSGSGTWKSTPPANDLINIFAGASIDFQSSTSTGGVTGGTVKTNGGVFTRPTITSGEFTRMALVYHPDNYVDTTFSASAVTEGGLTNAGTLFAGLEGTPIGYIDLESEGTFNFKTAGSSTSVISNDKIYIFSSGAGGGAGGDTSFKIQNVASDGISVIKGGRQAVYVGTGVMLVSTYDGTGSSETDFDKDLAIDLDNLEASPVNDTTYHLFINLFTLATNPTTVTETGVNLYPIEEANLVLRSDDPYDVESSQFVYIGSVRYATGQWSESVKDSSPTKRHSSSIAANNSLEYSLDFTPVSTVGTAGQIAAGHTLMAPSFPSSADVSWYNLDGNALDGNTTNANDLIVTGAPITYGTGILGIATSNMTLNGTTQYLNSTDAYFNPGNADHSFGGWFNSDNWTTNDQTLMANWGSIGNYSFKVAMDALDNLVLYTSVDGTAIVSDTITTASLLSGWHFISLVYTATDNMYSCYVDSILALEHLVGGALNTSASSNFTIGSDAGANFFAGNIDEIFFSTDTALADDQVQKLYTTKISHNRSLNAIGQAWSATAQGYGQTLPYTDFIVDMGYNDLYATFSKLPSTVEIALKLLNKSSLGRAVSIQSREIESIASTIDSILPITHNIGNKPYVVLLVDDGTGEYEIHDAGSYFKTTNTQITSTGVSLATSLGSGTNCVLRWSSGAQGVVAQYRDWTTQVVSTATVLSNNDKVLANPTGQLDLTLPSNPSLGWTIRVSDFDGTWSLTDFVRLIPAGGDTVMGSANLDLTTANDYLELTYNGTSDWRMT